jgi:hypothetical protein
MVNDDDNGLLDSQALCRECGSVVDQEREGDGCLLRCVDCASVMTTGERQECDCSNCSTWLDQVYDGPSDGDAWSGGFVENH